MGIGTYHCVVKPFTADCVTKKFCDAVTLISMTRSTKREPEKASCRTTFADDRNVPRERGIQTKQRYGYHRMALQTISANDLEWIEKSVEGASRP